MKKILAVLAVSATSLGLVSQASAWTQPKRSPRPPMTVAIARSQAQSLLTEWEQAAHRDPDLNVRDDEDHAGDPTITCRRVNRSNVDCKTAVTFSQDAYHYETVNGVPHVVSPEDQVSWTMRFGWYAAIYDWHLLTTFPSGPKAANWPSAANFGGKAIHRVPTAEKDVCGSPGYPCSFVPYPGS